MHLNNTKPTARLEDILQRKKIGFVWLNSEFLFYKDRVFLSFHFVKQTSADIPQAISLTTFFSIIPPPPRDFTVEGKLSWSSARLSPAQILNLKSNH